MGQGKDERDAVVVRACGQTAADRDEAGLIGLVVVDVVREDGQTVERSSLLRAYRCQRQIARSRDHLRSNCGVCSFLLLEAVLFEEILTLTESRLDGIRRAHRLQGCAGAGAQTVIDVVDVGVRDVQIVLHEQVTRLVDGAHGRVFDRNNTGIGTAFADRAEHVLKGGNVADFLGIREHGRCGLCLIGGWQTLIDHTGGLIAARCEGQLQTGGFTGQDGLILVLARYTHDRFEHGYVFLTQTVGRLCAQGFEQILFAVGL